IAKRGGEIAGDAGPFQGRLRFARAAHAERALPCEGAPARKAQLIVPQAPKAAAEDPLQGPMTDAFARRHGERKIRTIRLSISARASTIVKGARAAGNQARFARAPASRAHSPVCSCSVGQLGIVWACPFSVSPERTYSEQ